MTAPTELAHALARREMVRSVERTLGPIAPRFADALLAVPRERFVRAEDVARAAEDMPLPLDDAGEATISAPHAYVLSFALVDLAPGDTVLELGTGTGYGAALAAHVVGGAGRVVTLEIDRALAARARALLADLPRVTTEHADASRAESLIAALGARKVIATFAVRAIPASWRAALPDGGVLVAPVGEPGLVQRLVRITRRGGAFEETDHGGVRYVPDRSREGA